MYQYQRKIIIKNFQEDNKFMMDMDFFFFFFDNKRSFLLLPRGCLLFFLLSETILISGQSFDKRNRQSKLFYTNYNNSLLIVHIQHGIKRDFKY